jgi:2-methylisocitrate lyase-like PEP mutase family enzyme
MPCCFDPLSGRLVERAGFSLTFMSGFAVSAARLGLPDTGLISYAEMVDQGRNICASISIPVIGDGDTGYGNVVNVQRTMAGYSQAGFGGIMLEDQRSPKRCGHTRGKEVVSRDEAESRIAAAVAAREAGHDLVIVARTDACAIYGLDEAIARCHRFHELGAEITFLEAPRNEDEMRRYCAEVPGMHMANMVEEGDTPILPPEQLAEIGYQLVAYPLTLLSSAAYAMQRALSELRDGRVPDARLDFAQLRELVGFSDYDELAARYKCDE